jgi:hypothetical protein
MLDVGNIKFGATLKAFFFDKPRVVKLIDDTTRRAFSRFGAFVRDDARKSIRTRKKASQPGNPPNSHTGILKRFIYFALDPNRRSVIIGPAKTNQIFFGQDRRPVSGTVPEVLEYGGAIGILEVQKSYQGGTFWTRADLRSRRRLAGRPLRLRQVNIRPRPYMHPAFDKNLTELPRIWADSAH